MILAAVVQSFGISSICHYKTYANSYGIVIYHTKSSVSANLHVPSVAKSEEELDGVMFVTVLNEDMLVVAQRLVYKATCRIKSPIHVIQGALAL